MLISLCPSLTTFDVSNDGSNLFLFLRMKILRWIGGTAMFSSNQRTNGWMGGLNLVLGCVCVLVAGCWLLCLFLRIAW